MYNRGNKVQYESQLYREKPCDLGQTNSLKLFFLIYKMLIVIHISKDLGEKSISC